MPFFFSQEDTGFGQQGRLCSSHHKHAHYFTHTHTHVNIHHTHNLERPFFFDLTRTRHTTRRLLCGGCFPFPFPGLGCPFGASCTLSSSLHRRWGVPFTPLPLAVRRRSHTFTPPDEAGTGFAAFFLAFLLRFVRLTNLFFVGLNLSGFTAFRFFLALPVLKKKKINGEASPQRDGGMIFHRDSRAIWLLRHCCSFGSLYFVVGNFLHQTRYICTGFIRLERSKE